jgi:chromosome segregation protein
MRIKRIEIIGFKSFCDRTVVTIDEPITAIVGPNGCGKSNIVDAIRWCMGEQSAKHLRGKSMDDVIFAGSDSRGPAGMAEVSLTFENVGFSHHDASATVLQDVDVAAVAETPDGSGEAVVEGEAQPGGPFAEPDAAPAQGPSIHELAEAAASELDALVAEAAQVLGDQDAGATADVAAGEAAEDGAAAPAAEVLIPEAAAILDEQPPAIDYSQYGEVTISRRLFRDGTSEYFINKTPSRLRDVHDFFLGTGVGTKAYSIIEQGRVGMIVSAKPDERRLIIEEAAGITKFKKKKQAAERKMEQTRQNLLRVSDVVDEIDKRLGSLRRQAQKAERYKKYRAEMRDIELWSASHRYLGLGVEEGVMRVAHGEASERRARLAHELEQREAALAAERAEAQLEDKAIADLTQVVFDLENQVKLGESQVDFQTREAVGLEERAKSAATEIEVVRAERAQAKTELEQASDEVSRHDEGTRARAELLARLEEEQRMVRGRLADAQAELDGARAEITRASTDIARTEAQVRSIERRQSDLDMRLSRIGDEAARSATRLEPLQHEVQALDGKLAGLRQLRFDLGQEKDQLEARLKQLKDDVHHGEAEVETLRTELHRRRSRLQSLIEIQDRYEGFARGTRAIMTHRPGDDAERRRIKGLLADVVSAEPEYEPAVEALLGERLGSILVEDKAVSVAALAFLKEKSEGRSTFIPVAGFGGGGAGAAGGGAIDVVDATGIRGPIAEFVRVGDEYAGVAEHLFGDAIVVESLARALELLDAGVHRTMVTLDGDLIDPRGVVTGGSRETAGAGVLQQKREIRELEEISASLAQDLANAQARHVAHKAELLRVTAALDGVRKQNHESEISILAQEKDLARFRSEAERLVERQRQLDDEKAELDGAHGEGLRELEEHKIALEQARRRGDDAERQQLGLIEGVTLARGQVEDVQAQVTDAKVVVAQAQAAQRAAQAQKGRLELAIAELDRRLDKLARTADESGRRAEELRGESTRIGEELVVLRADRFARADELGARKNEHEQRMVGLQVADLEVREVRQAADKAGHEAAKLELRLHDLHSHRQHLLESIFEKHRVELVKELHDHHLRPPVSEAEEARLRELRELIERMGEINLTAIEEFEELNKRYEFLTSQKKDLETALEQLERAISKINKTSRKLFRDTFDAVNAKFKDVFPKLFRGGSAELKLTGGEDDLLDAGVEIFAQPPGKKNQTVELLSGGEKALTAVSMIFSIFLIKPSPFCLLDEVDAPLDEANVGRYNDIVRSMTDRSQFIVITHNKRTMEIADDLYGVTMEEPGVSKLVSVRLRGFERRKRAA